MARQLAGAPGGHVYQRNRVRGPPTADYTARVMPRCDWRCDPAGRSANPVAALIQQRKKDDEESDCNHLFVSGSRRRPAHRWVGSSCPQTCGGEFKLEWAEMEERHQLNFATYEEGKLTLEEYLDRVVFCQKRPFTRAQFRRFMFAQSKPYPRDDRVRPQAQGKVRTEDRRGQQRIARTECVSDSQVQAGQVCGFFCFLLLRRVPQARRRYLSAGAGHRADAGPADSLYRKHATVRPGRGRFGDSRHSAYGLQLHLRETGFVRIAG